MYSPIVLLMQLLVLVIPIPHLLHLREWESNFPLDSFAIHQLICGMYPDIPNVFLLFSFIVILAFITIPWHLQGMQITNSVLHQWHIQTHDVYLSLEYSLFHPICMTQWFNPCQCQVIMECRYREEMHCQQTESVKLYELCWVDET